MSWLRRFWLELWGLFVDDGSYALAMVFCVVLAAVVLLRLYPVNGKRQLCLWVFLQYSSRMSSVVPRASEKFMAASKMKITAVQRLILQRVHVDSPKG
jgi:hypothetical protein